MHHVKGVGDIPQEFARAGGRSVGRQSRSTYPYKQREEHDGADSVVEAVHPVGRAAADVRHREQDDDGQAADPEGTPDTPWFEDARHQQSRREGEEQPQEAALQVGATQRPSHAQMAVAGEAADGIGGQSRRGQGDQHLQRACRQAAQYQRVEDVTDIFEEERPARPVQREHLTVAPHLGPRTRQRGNQK